MDEAKRQKYEQAMEVFGQDPDWPPFQLMVAICLTQLGKYADAKRCYDRTIQGFLNNRRAWYELGQSDRLVNTLVLANRPDLHFQVLEEVEAYKLGPRGQALVALYAYALMRLLLGRDDEVKEYVAGLLQKPKYKDIFAMGKTIQAIVERDQSAFDMALNDLLTAHRGKAKFGELRESPEGFLCLPAMSLSKIALDRGLVVTAESEYLSMGYLAYLAQEQ